MRNIAIWLLLATLWLAMPHTLQNHVRKGASLEHSGEHTVVLHQWSGRPVHHAEQH